MPVIPGSVALTDTINGPPAIKPASTAAIATDLALVVAVSPNNTIPISATSLPLPAGASTAALQTQPGVDIGDVTVNNAAGAAAVNIQDGGNSITVDGLNATPVTALWTAATALNTSVSLSVIGYSAGLVIIRKTGIIISGAITVSVSYDGVSFITLPSTALSSGLISVRQFPDTAVNPILISAISDYDAYIDVAAWNTIKVQLTTVIATAVEPGTVEVFIGASASASAPQTNLARIVGTVALGDTVNGPVAVKPASTIAVAADPALVIAPSPNTPLGGAGQQLMAASLPVVLSSDQTAIPITGTVTALSNATATENNPSYTEGDITAAFSQDLEGNLRTRIAALVSDARESYINGEIQSLSLTSDGRLRVSTSPSDTNLDFFGGFNPYGNADDFGISSDNPYQQSFPLGRG